MGASKHDVGVVLAGYVFLLLTSGFVTHRALKYVEDEMPDGSEVDAGTVIGKCENVLVLTFFLVGEFTAMAVIFAAEGIVSRDEELDARYVLTGTLVNFTYSIVVGVVLTQGFEWGFTNHVFALFVGGSVVAVGVHVIVH